MQTRREAGSPLTRSLARLGLSPEGSGMRRRSRAHSRFWNAKRRRPPPTVLWDSSEAILLADEAVAGALVERQGGLLQLRGAQHHHGAAHAPGGGFGLRQHFAGDAAAAERR